ncbi:transmembrane protein [Anaeramoeba ignava]|uniref:Transmembrane protein n=1 Tax=Anaeramoeba ignava TaxID=1746090 RepID=A0A9Q0R4P9_ANAIG|nr:transmembrane protein [Anaeramoeba ignava]
MVVDTKVGKLYSNCSAFIFTFNLIVGIGSLTLPNGFREAGLLLSTLFIIFLALLSYICVTFMVEAQAIVNLVFNEQNFQNEEEQEQEKKEFEITPLLGKEIYSESDQILDGDNLNLSPKQEIKEILKSTSSEKEQEKMEDNDYLSNSEDDLKGESDQPEDTTLFLDKKSPILKSENINTEIQEEPKILKMSQTRKLDLKHENPPELEITKRVEMSTMSEMLLGKGGRIAFYIVIIVYLYGDLSIYAATIPVSLSKTIGGFGSISEDNSYYFYLLLFGVVVLPFCFFNFQKSKWLQIFTLTTRNIAFIIMIILSIIYIGENKPSPKGLPIFRLQGLPLLYGVSVYSFMSHHSIPGIISPVRKKNKIKLILGLDYFSIMLAYLFFCYVAVFAFGNVKEDDCKHYPSSPCKIQRLYTLNFESYGVPFIAKYVALFPVMICSNYPLISITLRNNLQAVFRIKPTSRFYRYQRVVFTIVGSFPPLLIAFFIRDVSLLVDFTGSYAGICIMFLFPTLFVLFGRKQIHKKYGKIHFTQQSPFQSKFWLYLIIGWSIFALVFNTVIQILQFCGKKIK